MKPPPSAPPADPWDAVCVSLVHADLYPCRPDWRIEPLASRHDCFFFIGKGQGWVERDGNRYEARPGDLFIVRAGHRFAAGHAPERPVTVYSTGFRLLGPGQADAWRHLTLPDRLRLPEPERRTIEAAYQVLVADWRTQTPLGRLAARGALLRLAAEVLRLAADLPASCREGATGPLPGEETRAAEAIAYMDAHLAQPLDLAALARAAHLSPAYFAALFRRQTGQAPMHYLRARRVETARALLGSGDYSVEQVARAVGFVDPFHFSRVFRRLVGVAPSAYRASLRNPFQG